MDNGYDISDFTDIDPLFGDLNDFDELLKAMHVRDMKLVLDFVPNHTSDEPMRYIHHYYHYDHHPTVVGN